MRLYQTARNRIKNVDRVGLKNPYDSLKTTSEGKKQKPFVIVHWSSKSSGFLPTVIGHGLVTLRKLTGQCPRITFSRKGVARLAIREGARVGGLITLRGRSRHRFIRSVPQITPSSGITVKKNHHN